MRSTLASRSLRSTSTDFGDVRNAHYPPPCEVSSFVFYLLASNLNERTRIARRSRRMRNTTLTWSVVEQKENGYNYMRLKFALLKSSQFCNTVMLFWERKKRQTRSSLIWFSARFPLSLSFFSFLFYFLFFSPSEEKVFARSRRLEPTTRFSDHFTEASMY